VQIHHHFFVWEPDVEASNYTKFIFGLTCEWCDVACQTTWISCLPWTSSSCLIESSYCLPFGLCMGWVSE